MVLKLCGHETSGWPQLYERDPDFAATYQMLGANIVFADFHLQDELLCHMDHLCIPSSKRAKLIWESHSSWVARHTGVEKTMAMSKFIFDELRQDVNKHIRSCTTCAIAKLTIKKQGMYTLCLLLKCPRNPSRWTTCRSFRQTSGEMTVFLWWLIIFLKWWLLSLARRASQQRPLPSSSSNECGYIMGYHKP
jgi:hypothetical protein